MKKFEFRLQQVFQLKEQRERLAALKQQQAQLAHEAACNAVQTLESLLEHLAAMPAETTGASWLTRQQEAAILGEQLEQALQRQRQALQALQDASAARARIATEVESLQVLRQEQQQTHRYQAAREYQYHLDEQGMRSWMEARMAEGGGGDA